MDGRKGPLLVLEYPGGKGGGMNTKKYCEQVLDGVLEEFYTEVTKERDQVHFQQDNASCHVSKQMRKWFSDHDIPLLFHPPNSLDLLPIKRVWHKLKNIIRSLVPQPTTVDKLKSAVHSVWEQLDINDVNKHILSMPDHITAIYKVKGGHTWF
ncbi:hypothetical protein CVT25_006553 [Psilocybe cyanescens]|uniref:Tc1-like transposase DDE domain-containing protein n=1 Tax=Psilocybe cyanescens TaxID=93625 RepID=A0A409XKS6_PSICY|nr:hypothetical protein CVT25_006553 [Psilocybe cyanescens]